MPNNKLFIPGTRLLAKEGSEEKRGTKTTTNREKKRKRKGRKEGWPSRGPIVYMWIKALGARKKEPEMERPNAVQITRKEKKKG